MVRLLVISILACILTGCGAYGEKSDFLVVAKQRNYAVAPVSVREKSLILSMLHGNVLSIVLMKDDDRMAAAWWMNGSNSTEEFAALKARVFRRLSPNVYNVIDESLNGINECVIYVLAFNDDALFDERILIARTRDIIIEFHFQDKFESDVMNLLLSLSAQGRACG